MASIKCEMCGAHMEAETEEELAEIFQKHSKDVHDMELSDEEALRKVTEGRLGDI
ncbi:MAG: DUF1059 domain-containing protein [Anaerolineales bacterium]|nr:MAG: DUF1059 domain-containing protein [Anaerolineales bacterium]